MSSKCSRSFIYEIPKRRRIQVFAFDPMLGRAPINRVTIDVANETLLPGPLGSRIEVIDYDGALDCFYPPLDLDSNALLMQDGMEPTELDPRFHQQMVYAIGCKVVENFESALGRRISFRGHRRLRLFPHAFQGANAYYDRSLVAILFGYFKADKRSPGANLPGQTVFSCLSQDIIAHEMTHALVDRLRPYFMEPTNRDVLAFHEGFADIVAIFQHFSFRAILIEVIQQTRAELQSPSTLIELAKQFGYATGRGQALRNVTYGADASDGKPDASLYSKSFEAHERGAILVAAVFEAFFTTYQVRIKDLIRIATRGSGQLPKGDLHPDLVNRIAAEASEASQAMLRMCIRAFDYLPPVDVTFGDYLRALVTADYELSPTDLNGQRASTIESFRVRGIYPEKVSSLAQSSILLEPAADDLPLFPTGSLGELIVENFSQSVGLAYDAHFGNVQIQTSRTGDFASARGSGLSRKLAFQMHNYATQHAAKLGLDPALKISLSGFHPVFRITPYGQLLVEMVAQFIQTDNKPKDDLGGLPLRGGVTLIASAEGKVRYVISKPLPSPKPSRAIAESSQREAMVRYHGQQLLVEQMDASDPHIAWASKDYFRTRVRRTMSFALLHRDIHR